MSKNIMALMLGAGIVLEMAGPVRRKMTLEDYARLEAERNARYEEQRARRQQRIEAERQHEAALRALTSDAEWARIARDEQRRAAKKAAKKARP